MAEPPTLSPVALPALPALSAVPLVYAALRTLESASSAPQDPAAVIWATPIAFFWRIALSLYLAALLGLVSWVLSKKHPTFPLRAATWLVPIACVVSVLQAMFFP